MNKLSGQNGLNQADECVMDTLVDVVLIGGGIMSATLGTFIQQLEPNWSIAMFERLSSVAQESSNGWNNAGTGHSSLAESNYTPETSSGEVKMGKAVDIYEQFQQSRQFWAYLVEQGLIKDPSAFITSVPHMSFVFGDTNVNFLRKRYATLKQSPLFDGMVYSEDRKQIANWAPTLMQGRDENTPVAATRSRYGTDVNFGALTHQMVNCLQQNDQFELSLNHEVTRLKRNEDGSWRVTVKSLIGAKSVRTFNARYVFIGAGGASLTLLQKSGIPEAKRYAGFPVGGQFLVTKNPELVAKHQAKVYGKAAVGAPPMSVPHLDTRVIDGKEALLFGPFASFSTKFLKEGSLLDLFASVNAHNVMPMTKVGLKSFDLVKYLVGQLMQSDEDRLAALRDFMPEAKAEDWSLIQAGQRVQIIRKMPDGKAELHLGSELVHAEDGSLTALLGASPGASVSAAIMLELLERCFSVEMQSSKWKNTLKQMIPSYGFSLNVNPELNQEVLIRTSRILGLEHDIMEIRNTQTKSPQSADHNDADYAELA
jgi:malate dehydrogenase (quinone)